MYLFNKLVESLVDIYSSNKSILLIILIASSLENPKFNKLLN
jgi:hypothetical protein